MVFSHRKPNAQTERYPSGEREMEGEKKIALCLHFSLNLAFAFLLMQQLFCCTFYAFTKYLHNCTRPFARPLLKESCTRNNSFILFPGCKSYKISVYPQLQRLNSKVPLLLCCINNRYPVIKINTITYSGCRSRHNHWTDCGQIGPESQRHSKSLKIAECLK